MENLATKDMIIMNESLDLSKKEFEDILQKTLDIILHQYEIVNRMKGFHSFPQKEVESWFDEPLPFFGENIFQVLDDVKKNVFDTATGNLGPNMYGYVVSGGNQISTVGGFPYVHDQSE